MNGCTEVKLPYLGALIVIAISFGLVAATPPPSRASLGPMSRAEWLAFQTMTEEQLQGAWSQRGAHLGEWPWQWRLGWVRASARVGDAFAREILAEGLRDRALVVRAASARTLGGDLARRLGATWAREELVQAFRQPRNGQSRGRQVEEAVLFALFKLGGDARAQGARLAGTKPNLEQYWKRLEGA